MNVLKIIKISGYRAPITGLVLSIWRMQLQALTIYQDGLYVADDGRLIEGFLPGLSCQYKGCAL